MSGAGASAASRRRTGSKAASKSYSALGAARSKAALARKAQLRLMRQVAKDVVYSNRETKWVCKTIGDTSCTSVVTSIATVLNDVDAGDGESQRDGLKIKQLGISLRWAVKLPADRNQSLRILVLEEKAAFTSADIPQTILACVTPKMKAHFNVLHDHVYQPTEFNKTTDPTGDERVEYHARYFRVPRTVTFPDGTGSNLEKGAISLWAVRDDLITGTGVAGVSAEAICYFKEI